MLIDLLIEYHKVVFVLGPHRVRRGNDVMQLAKLCGNDVEGQVADRPWLPSRRRDVLIAHHVSWVETDPAAQKKYMWDFPKIGVPPNHPF